jgi:pyruvate carboxylase subunit B
MTQAQVERCLPYYKDAKFFAMEVWGGAVPDSVMRYLSENPWTRLESIKAAVGDVSKLTALSRGRNLFGYAPYTDEIIEGFCRNSIESGLGIMRIFDCLNDVDNVKSTIKYVKKYGGIADCAVCYTVDPKYPKLGFWDKLRGKKNPALVFTDDYFVGKAKELAALGADMITIKDMSGLIPPQRVSALIKKLKAAVSIPIDFHTHCTPGYGLASVYAAIAAGVDVVDTNCWWFGGGTGAPALELVYLFCQKMGVELGVNMEAVAKINAELQSIRSELNVSVFGTDKPAPKAFNPLTDAVPAEVEAELNRAVKAAQSEDFNTLLAAAQAIEAYFGFPAPNKLVQEAEIPGGMYSNMVAQLQALKAEDILPRAMELIPTVRLSAGLPPLVTPTSQIVGAQAVNCALDEKAGRAMYTTKNNQFVNLVKGEYGKTPVAIDPEFRLQICGVREETAYDISKYQRQPNPELPEAGGVLLAENEKEELLLELFPLVAKPYLTNVKKKAYEATVAASAPAEKDAPVAEVKQPITGKTIAAPLPGKVIDIKVKVGDTVAPGQEVVVLEAMKMENSITADFGGVVKQILVAVGDNVASDAIILEIGDAAPAAAPAAPAAAVSGNKVVAPLPGRVITLKVKVGDSVSAGDEVALLEAMKMENSITSDYTGTVQQILVAEGENIATDAVIMIIG